MQAAGSSQAMRIFPCELCDKPARMQGIGLPGLLRPPLSLATANPLLDTNLSFLSTSADARQNHSHLVRKQHQQWSPVHWCIGNPY